MWEIIINRSRIESHLSTEKKFLWHVKWHNICHNSWRSVPTSTHFTPSPPPITRHMGDCGQCCTTMRHKNYSSTKAKNNVLKLSSRASASFQGQKKYRLFHHYYRARRCTDTNTLTINCESTSYQPEHPSPSFAITQDNPVISSLTRKLSLAQVHVPIYQKDTFTDLLQQRKKTQIHTLDFSKKKKNTYIRCIPKKKTQIHKHSYETHT